MKKVAFFLSGGNTIGGHEFQTIELILDAQKYCEVTVFLNTINKTSLFEGKKINFILCDKPFFRNGFFILQYFYGLFNLFRLRKLTKLFDLIIVSAGTVEMGISIGIALWGKNIYQYVPTYIDRIPLWGNFGCLYNILLPIFILPYKKIITINRFQGKCFAKYKHVFIIPNRIFPIDKKNIEKKEFCRIRKIYFIGRFDINKRILELIELLDNPLNKFKLLIIVGDGPEKDNIVEKSKNVKYIKVVLTGWLNKEKQEEMFTANDVFISNSAIEGEPLVIREANERGSVVIAKDIWGHRGCTFKSNRFKNKDELIRLVNMAYENKLRIFKNRSIDEINRRRENAVQKIFI